MPAAAQPFLKWAGGKRQLLATLRRFVPAAFRNYYEPFIGSGALFFDLYGRGRLEGRSATLSDSNADLIGCWTQVRDRVDDVIDRLRALEAGHRASPAAHYYRVRDDRFNPERLDALRSGRSLAAAYTPPLAAMLVYLNRTGFNGLFRLNASGAFNVPAGRYANPRICDEPNLRAVSEALRCPDVRLLEAPFVDSVRHAGPGDLVYFDPPYAPLSRTSDFTSYTSAGFGPRDQESLQRLVLDLVERGCSVILSNSTAPEIAALYRDSPEARQAGLRAHAVPARRAINSKPAARGDVMEFVITNVAVD
jgi:DNA adenine methylase